MTIRNNLRGKLVLFFSGCALSVLFFQPNFNSFKFTLFLLVIYFFFLVFEKKPFFFPISRQAMIWYSFFSIALLSPTFYVKWKDVSRLAHVIQVTHMTTESFLIFTGVLLSIISFPLIYIAVQWLIQAICSIFPPDLIHSQHVYKSFLILLAINFTGILAIIRANFNYIDDVGRVVEGYQGWQDFSRYVSVYLSPFVHGNLFLSDISPIPQLLAAVVISVSSFVLIRIITGSYTPSMPQIIATIPLGLSPYFLGCFAYKYDSLYMALSVFFSIVPLLFEEKSKKYYFLAVVICTILMCCSYQASSGIFPLIVIFILFIRFLHKDDFHNLTHFAFSSAGAYLCGLAFFKFFILPTSSGGYRSTSVLPANGFIKGMISNYFTFFFRLVSTLPSIWLYVILAMVVLFLFVAIAKSSQPRGISFFSSVLYLVLSAILMWGVFPVLADPPIGPRSMYGFGVFLAVLQLYVVSNSSSKYHHLLPVVIGWLFFIFSFTYGNALNVQKEYTDFRITEIIEDIKDIDYLNDCDENQKITLAIYGNIGFSPALQPTIEAFPLLKELIPFTFSGMNYWGVCEFEHYYGLDDLIQIQTGSITADGIDLWCLELPILSDNLYHIIRGNNEYLFVILK